MGSRSDIELAYIASFLDGDGSLMLQIKKRPNNKVRFMATICFYQDSRHEATLIWIREVLSIGYIARRNDGMTELRINGFKQTKNILGQLIPYIRFKQHQAVALYKAGCMLDANKFSNLTRLELEQIVNYIITIQSHNYVARYKKSELELKSMLGLTP